MYLPGEAGKPGILILRESAGPKVIMEELLHFEQHRLLGFKKLSAAEMLQMENEAHEALLYYGKSKGWSKAELAQLEENQQYWKNKTEEFAKNPEAVEKELKGLKNVGQEYFVTFNGDKVPVYRGGSSFKAEFGHVKINKETGMVRTTHGVSLEVFIADAKKHGDPHKIISIPTELRIIQRGSRLEHFEIVPAFEMPFDDYQKYLNQVIAAPI